MFSNYLLDPKIDHFHDGIILLKVQVRFSDLFSFILKAQKRNERENEMNSAS